MRPAALVRARLVALFVASTTTLSWFRWFREWIRWLTMQPHTVTAYLRVNDPYSYLLLQVLQELKECFRIELKARTVLYLIDSAYPERDMWDDYALLDCKRLAPFHRLEFLDSANQVPERVAMLASRLLLYYERDASDWIPNFLRVFDIVWKLHNDSEEECVARLQSLVEECRAARSGLLSEDDAEKELRFRQKNFIKEGHYLSATLHYSGEWYWGLDRLNHLIERFESLKLQLPSTKFRDVLTKQYPTFEGERLKRKNEKLPPLDFYFSFRSPYSYISLERVYRFVDKYNIELNIKPLLPMVMRGLPVPLIKRLYIVRDTKREAERFNVPFGVISDPVGVGVERLFAIYQFAKAQNKEREYLLAVARGVWSEAVDAATDEGLSLLVSRAGLDWAEASKHLSDSSWREMAESNRKDLIALRLWGVPCFQFGSTKIWGQDRFWLLEQVARSYYTAPTTASAKSSL